MSEISKLYENAGIKCLHPSGFCKHIGAICEVCERHKYPPFTAEKQIELIKWLSSKYGIYIVNLDKYSIGFGTCVGEFCTKENFEDVLAESINHLWQDLTEEEKQQVKGILE